MSVVPDEILVATGKQIIKQEDLDLDSKTRTSFFSWRGQFSPQLVEVLLNAYAHTDSVILDPFAGSGTTLFESARKKLACYAAEINPSAVEMANTAHFTNLSSLQRSEKLQQAQEIFKERFGDIQSLLYLESENKVTSSNIELSLTTCVGSVAEDSFLRNVFVNTLIRYRNQKKKGAEALLREYQNTKFRDRERIISQSFPELNLTPNQIFQAGLV
ncbi:site-specific DNA methyltransferase [Nostoc cycadae WK-1]|uniref:Site-specific DNA methyltransferase n=2 Tax=Nostoc cycadae TaxID=246795 RepID=A0A2H6LDC0_9NOSO|nr:site-specific DNA methyltransferase [Nostoc cycadae WK-1]